MELLVVSFLAGALTVLAPCILPLLPIVVGGSLGGERYSLKPFIITGSLAVSVFVFTLLLRASTTFLHVPIITWQIISGLTILLLGIAFLYPRLWERVAIPLNAHSSQLLGRVGRQKGLWHDVLTGAALGPVFSSCSPTYAFILAAILPRSWLEGIFNLAAYVVGLCAMLLLASLTGQSLAEKLSWVANSRGVVKRIVGVLFLLVGATVLFGLDKDLQAFIIDHGWYAPVEHLEQSLRK